MFDANHRIISKIVFLKSFLLFAPCGLINSVRYKN